MCIQGGGGGGGKEQKGEEKEGGGRVIRSCGLVMVVVVKSFLCSGFVV